MPTTTQTITTSGISEIDGQSSVYVTYDAPQLGYENGQFDRVPGIVYLGCGVTYKKDNMGNILAVSQNADGSDPI